MASKDTAKEILGIFTPARPILSKREIMHAALALHIGSLDATRTLSALCAKGKIVDADGFFSLPAKEATADKPAKSLIEVTARDAMKATIDAWIASNSDKPISASTVLSAMKAANVATGTEKNATDPYPRQRLARLAELGTLREINPIDRTVKGSWYIGTDTALPAGFAEGARLSSTDSAIADLETMVSDLSEENDRLTALLAEARKEIADLNARIDRDALNVELALQAKAAKQAARASKNTASDA